MKKGEKINVDVYIQKGLTKIIPRQNLDMSSSPALRKFFLRLLKKKVKYAVADLKFVDNIDTSGLATLVEFAFHLRENGGEIVVCGLKADSTDILSLEQVKKALNFCNDCGQAVERLDAEKKGTQK